MAGPLGSGVGLWFGAAIVAPQVLAAALYLGAPPAARGRLAPIPLAALLFAALQSRLGLPAPLVAPALVAAAAAALPLVAGAGAAREWRAAGTALGLMLWGALLVAPADTLGIEAEFGPVFAAMTAAAALAAHWPALAAAYREPGREPPLPWFLWSAGHGGWALLGMAGGVPWAFLAFPLAAQAMTLGVGLLALEGRAGEAGEGEPAAR
ncbi:MAG: hypothetical protein DI556_22840 [Rhodovulum sulfidophilum]|uniref:Uncharacterized protein n=1 Tax=Rhodovulum sulfidophilum TaxID=35806 RepID=A0A2W5PSE7_RHOSU|nr:MAG: hypothetical protein DI556_22840 [Rhodovulum sulfidophilum]